MSPWWRNWMMRSKNTGMGLTSHFWNRNNHKKSCLSRVCCNCSNHFKKSRRTSTSKRSIRKNLTRNAVQNYTLHCPWNRHGTFLLNSSTGWCLTYNPEYLPAALCIPANTNFRIWEWYYNFDFETQWDRRYYGTMLETTDNPLPELFRCLGAVCLLRGSADVSGLRHFFVGVLAAKQRRLRSVPNITPYHDPPPPPPRARVLNNEAVEILLYTSSSSNHR